METMDVAFSLTSRKLLIQLIILYLKKKIDHCGMRGIPLQWFQSYLISTKQFVSVNGHSSMELKIKHGVPEGSVLGPLLFLLYINDLPSITKKLTFYLFADDTNIYFELSDLFHLQINSKQRATESKKVVRK